MRYVVEESEYESEYWIRDTENPDSTTPLGLYSWNNEIPDERLRTILKRECDFLNNQISYDDYLKSIDIENDTISQLSLMVNHLIEVLNNFRLGNDYLRKENEHLKKLYNDKMIMEEVD